MRVIRVFSVCVTLAATCLIANAQTFSKVTAHVPYTVVLGSKQLPPGTYEILPVPGSTNGNLFAIYSEDRAALEGLLSAVRASESKPAGNTELVLRANGQGEYTLDQLRIAGKEGYEFRVPKSGSSREREAAAASVEVIAEAQ